MAASSPRYATFPQAAQLAGSLCNNVPAQAMPLALREMPDTAYGAVHGIVITLTSKSGRLARGSRDTASTNSLMPLRSSRREKKAIRCTGFLVTWAPAASSICSTLAWHPAAWCSQDACMAPHTRHTQQPGWQTDLLAELRLVAEVQHQAHGCQTALQPATHLGDDIGDGDGLVGQLPAALAQEAEHVLRGGDDVVRQLVGHALRVVNAQRGHLHGPQQLPQLRPAQHAHFCRCGADGASPAWPAQVGVCLFIQQLCMLQRQPLTAAKPAW